jgi:hypothetical protein
VASLADTGDVDAAMVATVKLDTVLMGLCPGGVYFGVAPQGIESFVIVDRLSHSNERNMYGAPASETYLFLVKAVLPGSSASKARAAGARIRALFELTRALPLTDYAQLAPVEEVESVRITEVDDSNPDRRVQHWGGHYEVTVQRLG